MSARIGDDFDIGLLNTTDEPRHDWDVNNLDTWNHRCDPEMGTIEIFDRLYKTMEMKINLEAMRRRMRMEKGKSKKKTIVEDRHDFLEKKVAKMTAL